MRRDTLTKKKLFKCAIRIHLLNYKIGKYTFSLVFMYFSEMGFMYLSEIYLKCHLSILDILRRSLNIFELYLCSQNLCFHCYMLVHIYCTELPKNTSEEETETTDASHVIKHHHQTKQHQTV